MNSPRVHHQQQGFTLIELMTVVVILSVVAAIGTNFMVLSTEAYNRTQQRARLINESRLALERMTRQLRVALPNGLRIINSGACLEFLPVVGGGNYLNPVPDMDNGVAASASIATAPHSVAGGPARYVAIGALTSAEIYNMAPASIADLSSRTSTSLTLSAAKIWQRNSLNRRFFLTDNAQAFCAVSNELRLYENQDITESNVDFNNSYVLLANNVVVGSAQFTLSPGTEDRNAKVTIALGFERGGEQVNFSQEVGLRNVP